MIMSILVENNLKNTENVDIFEQKAHYVPCKIDHDGPANVDKYFNTYVVQNDGELTASFRGYPLDGKEMALPAGYRAAVVTESNRPLAGDAHRKFQVVGGFSHFTYWNWDKKPSQNDNLAKALDWVDMAHALHGD